MIDWTRIEELVDEVGADDFAEIAGLFLAEVTGLLDGLSGGGTSDVYHSLKGSALNLGFAEMAALCAAAEADPAAADPGAIRTAFQSARHALDTRYPQLAA